jgi:hypothetical protein
MCSGKIAPKSGKLDDIVVERAVSWRGWLVGGHFIRKILLQIRKGAARIGVRICAVQHRDPEDSPAHDAEVAIKFTRRSAVHSFACSALQPDFMILWKVSIFYLRACQFSFLQVVYQSRWASQSIALIELVAIFGIVDLLRMHHNENEFRITLLFPNGRTDHHPAITDLKHSRRWLVSSIP